MAHELAPARGEPIVGPSLACGLATSLAVWIVWFITHLPWLGMREQVSLPVVLGVWVLASAATLGMWVGKRRALVVGPVAGVVAAALGLLVLGSKIAPDPAAGNRVAGELAPSVVLVAMGFLVLGAAMGLIGGLLGRLLGRDRGAELGEGTRSSCASCGYSLAGLTTGERCPECGIAAPERERLTRRRWLARYAAVAAAAVTPLLFVGGLVTSTDSGMAVPDWPNTFGSNMFLYPLGPRALPNVYLEHAHRLFGALVGLATLTLMVYVLVFERRRLVKAVAVAAFVLVCAQGALGGVRVLEDERLLAMLHGVLAQLLFGFVVALAAVLTPAFLTRPDLSRRADGMPRRFRFCTTGLLHALILQLVFGALYRHFRADMVHALWAHAGFSVVVVIFGLAAGFSAGAIGREAGAAERGIRRIGAGLVGVVLLQFILGWLTFMVGGREHQAATPVHALIRTAHQANGALLIALAALAFTWARWLVRQPAQAAASAQVVPAGA